MISAVDREWLTDMLDYARSAVRVLGSADADDLAVDEQKFLAVAYGVQIVGEAASKVSTEARAVLLSDVPWPKIIGMRHRLVHGYRIRRPDIMVQTVREDLPPLIVRVQRVLEDDPK